MGYQTIHVGVEDFIAVVTLARAPVNALNAQMRRELIDAFDSFSERENVRVIVLAAQGKTFCAGADLKDRPDADTPGAFSGHNRLTRETSNAIRECAKPVIAAINGAALGAGFGLAAASDIMIGSDNASFGMPEIDVGLAGGAALLRSLFGRSRLRTMLFTGRRYPAAELYRLGLLEACVAPEQLMDEAMALAREIAAKSPTGIRYAKTSANMVDLMPMRDAYRFEQNFTVELSKTEDAREARMAFVEKRSPTFTGR